MKTGVLPVLEVNTTMPQKTVFLFETIADSSTAGAELERYWLGESPVRYNAGCAIARMVGSRPHRGSRYFAPGLI